MKRTIIVLLLAFAAVLTFAQGTQTNANTATPATNPPGFGRELEGGVTITLDGTLRAENSVLYLTSGTDRYMLVIQGAAISALPQSGQARVTGTLLATCPVCAQDLNPDRIYVTTITVGGREYSFAPQGPAGDGRGRGPNGGGNR